MTAVARHLRPARSAGALALAALLARAPEAPSAAQVTTGRGREDTHSAGDRMRSPLDGREMAWVPPGEFQMGSAQSEPDRSPIEILQVVRIERGFWLDVTEVTNAAYRKFTAANPQWQKDRVSSKLADLTYLMDWPENESPDTDHHPVAYVSWHAARAYCWWAEKRLPTEAEWEYAARAGTNTARWWGPDLDPTRANHGGNGTEPVGNPRRTNPWGFSDILGNVWEWTSTLDAPRPYRSDGREDAAAPGRRIVRGGNWQSRFGVRAAAQDAFAPDYTEAGVGFRCAR